MKRLLLEPCADCKDLGGLTITSYLLGPNRWEGLYY